MRRPQKPPVAPITINIKDPHNFAVVAYNLDKPDVLRDIALAREQLNITLRPSRINPGNPRRELLQSVAMTIIQNNFLPGGFSDLVENAVLFGRVENHHYRTISYWLIGNIPPSTTDARADYLPGIYLGLHSLTTKEEMHHFVDHEFPKIKLMFEKIVYKRFVQPLKGTDNTKRDRKWYWDYVFGKSSKHIALHHHRHDAADNLDNWIDEVEKAIGRYHTKLIRDN